MSGFAPTIASLPWTPQLRFGAASVGMTFSTQTGFYTRVGPLVFIRVTLILSAKGSSTGDASISGLPFAGVATNQVVAGKFQMQNMSASWGDTELSPRVAGAVTAMTIYKAATTSIAALQHTDFADSSIILFNGIYEAG